MKKYVLIIFGVLAISLYSCDDDSEKIKDPEKETIVLNYDFETDEEGWDAGLTGYPADDEDLYKFNTEVTTSPVDEESGVVLLSSENPDLNNLFLYASKQVTGLEPNEEYSVSYTVDLTSNVTIDTTANEMEPDTTGIENDTTGISGSQNDSITIKVGALAEEPVIEADDLDFLQFTGIDIGDPGVDGSDFVVIGSFDADTTEVGFTEQTLSTDSPLSVTTNDEGDLWLLIGAETTGSAVEVYINSINVKIER